MTEKEAKENLFHLIHINTYLDLNKEEFKIKNETLIKWSESIDTVIQALEQKDKEISELRIKYISSNLNNSIKQKQKEDEQLQALNQGWKIELEKKDKEISELKEKWDRDTHTLQNQLDVANADRVEKDKIIDVIVQEYEYNAGINVKNFCKEEMRKDKCIQDCRCCIKQYFEKEVRKENE